jgi:hypothetical protein
VDAHHCNSTGFAWVNAASANFEQVTTKEDLSGLQLALLRKQYVYIQTDWQMAPQ